LHTTQKRHLSFNNIPLTPLLNFKACGVLVKSPEQPIIEFLNYLLFFGYNFFMNGPIRCRWALIIRTKCHLNFENILKIVGLDRFYRYGS